MRTTLIKDLKEKDVMAVLRQRMIANTFYWPRLFPLQFSPTLTWKTLAADQGIPVAADVVAFDSKAPLKKRDVVERLTGDIPKIEIARIKYERDINDYNQLLHYAGTEAGRLALVKWWADDVTFCTDGVNARLEWLALQALSLGTITLSKTNNAGGISTETAVTFNVPTAQKTGASVVWNAVDTTTTKPITDIKAIVTAAKALGYRYQYMLMDQDTFDNLAASSETQKHVAPLVATATAYAVAPTIEAVNAYMRSKNYPQIVIIDSLVTIENLAGTRSTSCPWTSGVVTFLPDLVAGNTFHAPLADEIVDASAALKVKSGHIMIKKFSTEDPVSETTKGMANAFPAWASATQAYMLDTLHASTWNH